MSARPCTCGGIAPGFPRHEHFCGKPEDEPLAWRVTADGSTVGTFDNHEDAQNMADVWNVAYPHEPWFKVVADFAP